MVSKINFWPPLLSFDAYTFPFLSTISEEDVLNANFFAVGGGAAAAAAVRDENDGEEKASRTTRHVRDMFLT
jgi:hypothetical protein